MYVERKYFTPALNIYTSSAWHAHNIFPVCKLTVRNLNKRKYCKVINVSLLNPFSLSSSSAFSPNSFDSLITRQTMKKLLPLTGQSYIKHGPMVPYHDIIKVVIKSDFESTLIKLMGQTCLIKHGVNQVIY